MHTHKYETINRPNVTPEIAVLGIKAAEIRKCDSCQKEMPFVFTKEGWFPLFEDLEVDEKDILLA
jgi:hypothetical protein